jgi:PAS domain S-box-containing protein
MSNSADTKARAADALGRGSTRKAWLLALLLFLFVLPLLGGTYWMYVQSKQEIEQGELNNDLIHARTLAAMVEKDFTSAEDILVSVADEPAFQSAWSRRDLPSLSRHLEQARQLDPALLFVSAYDTEGTLKVITPRDKIVGWNFAYRDWYRGVSAHWQPYVSEVYRTAAGSNPLVVAVAAPIRDVRGKAVGIVMGTYSLQRLTGKFRAIEKGSSADFSVLDQNGVLAASPTVSAQSDPVHFSVPGVSDRALASEEGSRRARVNDRNMFVGFAPIPRLGWAVLYARSENEALAPAWRLHSQFRSMTLYLLLIYLATAGLAALLVRRQSRLLAANRALNRGFEEKIAEARHAREELDRYFTMSRDLLCIAGYDGYFKRINPAWEKLLGWSTEELLAKPYLLFIHPDDVERTRQEGERQSQGLDAISFENRYRCKDGSYRWLMWNATGFVEAKSIFAMARDVTDLKQVQEALVAAKNEAERSNKFKDQFLSTMSHELRTPLNAVLGFSDLLADERYGPLTEKQHRYLKHIHTGGKHLLRLINDILDLSRIEAGRLQLAIESVRVGSVFSEVLDTLHPLASQKSHEMVKHPAPDISVRADGTRLRQILLNLVGNAIKFTPEGGKIELAYQREGETARIEIRDSGPGIAPEEQKRIFEAFYRLSHTAKAEGTGLGLAITQRLVELHGGHLGLDSQPGSGSCFYFNLPIVPDVELRVGPDASSLTKTGMVSRVVVVEDNHPAASLLESNLAAAGYEVTVCHEPERAVEVIAELQPAAATIDIVMKPINGWELLTRLKSDARTAHVPVIVVSIVDQPGTGALLGADEYIVKPVEKGLLLAAVERCISRVRPRSKRPILVVEDDAPTREFIAESLSQRGYPVDSVADGGEARTRVTNSLPELVILDLLVPTVSGFELLAEWRANSRTANLPVFVVTSKDLTPEEKSYLESNCTLLFRKQEPWQEALLRQLQRTATPVLVGKS